jgi:Spy/CpxP family protein refolding chaperone
MKHKWIYLTVAALTVGGAVATATAQRGMHKPRGPQAMMEELDLSDAQKAQLKELREEQREKMQALRASGQRPDREEMQAIFAEQREKMANILTAEQREKMENMHGQWAFGERPMRGQRGQWGHKGRGPNNGGPQGRMMSRDMRGGPRTGQAMAMLDLSDEQKEKVKSLREKQRQEMQELTKKHRAAVEKVLSKEQREKLAEMKDDAFYGHGPRR